MTGNRRPEGLQSSLIFVARGDVLRYHTSVVENVLSNQSTRSCAIWYQVLMSFEELTNSSGLAQLQE